VRIHSIVRAGLDEWRFGHLSSFQIIERIREDAAIATGQVADFSDEYAGAAEFEALQINHK
jgi:hypothetical protein